MFSVKQKRHIAEEIQKLLRSTNHPELPKGEVTFHLRVEGAESWSWAEIKNNGSVENPEANPWNERQDSESAESQAEERCPECGAEVRAKSMGEGGGVECSDECGWWFCF